MISWLKIQNHRIRSFHKIRFHIKWKIPVSPILYSILYELIVRWCLCYNYVLHSTSKCNQHRKTSFGLNFERKLLLRINQYLWLNRTVKFPSNNHFLHQNGINFPYRSWNVWRRYCSGSWWKRRSVERECFCQHQRGEMAWSKDTLYHRQFHRYVKKLTKLLVLPLKFHCIKLLLHLLLLSNYFTGTSLWKYGCSSMKAHFSYLVVWMET